MDLLVWKFNIQIYIIMYVHIINIWKAWNSSGMRPRYLFIFISQEQIAWVSWKRREDCITAPFLQFNLPPVLTAHPQRHILIRAPFPCLTTITICWSGFCGGLKRDRYQETFRGCLVQTVVWQGQLHLYVEIFFLSGVLEGSSVFSGCFSSLYLFFQLFHSLSKWQK